MLDEHNLHGYQWKSVNHIIENPAAMLFLKMGLGKTVSSLTAFNVLKYQMFSVRSALVIAPKRVMLSVWRQEAAKWRHLQHLRVIRVTGTPKQREAALRQPADIHVVGRDVIPWLCGFYRGEFPHDMLIIDEISSFKNPASNRFKALKVCTASFDRVVGLTGTPAPNSLLELWSQVYLLDRGERLGRFISHYRKEFFAASSKRVGGGREVAQYELRNGMEEAIYERISDITLSLGLENLDMPEKVEVDIEIELPAKVQKQYKDFKRESYLRIMEAGELVALNAGVLTGKLVQFANGAVYDADRNVIPVHKQKLEAIEQLIEEANGNPVLVFYSFIHDRDRLLEKFAKQGIVDMKSEPDSIERWNRGEIPIMIMHPKSGAHGLNLQAGGSTIIWYGVTWSLEDYAQANARLYRQGQQSETVSIYRILCKDTMDMRIAEIIKGKHEGQEALMSALKEELRDVMD